MESLERKVRIGICGVGHLGAQHARCLGGLPGSDLVGVYDTDRDRAREVATRWGVRAFDRFEDLLGDVEAVSCVAPTAYHYSIGIQVLECGKHLFLEKPMAQTAIQAQELLKEAKERGVKLGVGHIERYNPAVLAVQSHLRDPKFIEVHRLAAYNPRGTDVDVVLDLMIHDLDLIRNRMKGRPARVQAVGIPVITDRVDIANARLEFEDGAIANVTASRVSAEKMRKLRVFQSDAYLSIDCLNKSVEMYRKKDGRIFPFPVDVVADREPLKAELEGFLRAVIEDREPPISGIEGYQALELALWIRSEIDEHMRKVPIP
jgi:predicted dehydrogenase